MLLVRMFLCWILFLSSFLKFSRAEIRYGHRLKLQTSETKFLPHVHSESANRFPLGPAAVPGIQEYGNHRFGGPQALGHLHGAYGGLGVSTGGYATGNSFGNQGLSKVGSGGAYGLQNGFGNLHSTNSGYGNQYIGGNTNTFAKEKVFSQNKNFVSDVKGGFGTDYGFIRGNQGVGGYAGFGGLGAFGQGGIGAGQSYYLAKGVGGNRIRP